MDALTALPGWVLALIALVLVVQLSLMIWALVDISRRPVARLRGPRWLWVVVIIFGELIGPIIYLVVARLPESVDVAPQTPAADRVTTAADALYGPAAAAAATPAAAAPVAAAAHDAPVDEPVMEPTAEPSRRPDDTEAD